MNISLRTRWITLALLWPISVGSAAESDELAALRAEVQQLKQQVEALSRKLELQEEAIAAKTTAAPKVSVSDRGISIVSADAADRFRLGGQLQLDSRLFLADGGGVANDVFVLRRARLFFEGQFAKNYSYQFVPDFAGSSVTIFDANFTVRLSKAVQFKFGRFKVPLGLELLQSDASTLFNERSLATNLVPNRDLGIQLGGEWLDGRFSYQVGMFGGVADGASTNNADFQNDKEGVGRVMATPFKNEVGSAVRGLSFGVAGSTGREKTTSGRTAGYKTDGQQTFFAYGPAIVADGRSWRLTPQADYRLGSFGMMAEYVVSTIAVRPSSTGSRTTLRNTGWQVSAGYVLTGEDSSYNGVIPRTAFDLAAGTWGAVEVVARAADLDIDEKAFPTFASPATNADAARAIGLGLNWYLTKNVTFKFDYFETHFEFAPGAPAVSSTQILRQPEKAFITRFQLSF